MAGCINVGARTTLLDVPRAPVPDEVGGQVAQEQVAAGPDLDAAHLLAFGEPGELLRAGEHRQDLRRVALQVAEAHHVVLARDGDGVDVTGEVSSPGVARELTLTLIPARS